MNAPDQIAKIIVSNWFAAPGSKGPGRSPPLLNVLTIAGHKKSCRHNYVFLMMLAIPVR
jgi:hypothetical protein